MIKNMNPQGRHDNPNVYTSTSRASKCKKQKMDRTKRRNSNPTMMVGNLNIFLSEVNRTTRHNQQEYGRPEQ